MLTPRSFEFLRILAASENADLVDDDYETSEIVCEGFTCYLGTQRISYRSVRNLLEHCCLSLTSGEEATKRYGINGTGKGALVDPEVPDRVRLAILRNVPVDQLGNPLTFP
jgi:hypothetical protein